MPGGTGKSVRKRFGTINCQKHGIASTGVNVKWVKIAVPNTKKERFNGGCPFCNEEKKSAEKMAKFQIA